MDEEERKRRKIRQTIKVIIAEFCMILAVVAIVAVALLLSMGFSVTSDGGIEQTGLVQIHSMPTGATVEVDGNKVFSRTNLSRTLNAGEHSLSISKDGYDSWTKTIIMRSGVLLRVYYPRLFLLNREPEVVENLGEDFAFYSASTDRTSILYAAKASPIWKFINIKNDEIKITELNLMEVLPGIVDDKFTGEIDEVRWGSAGEYALAKVTCDGQTDWLMINLRDVKNSLNLTKTFGLNFTQVEMIGGAAGQLFVLENHQLRKINTSDQAISRVLLSDVQSFALNESNAVYVAERKDNDGTITKIVGIYKDGEKGGTVVATADGSATVRVALSKFYGESFVSYSIDDMFTSLYGNLPSYNPNSDGEASLNVLVKEITLSSIPEYMSVSSDENQFVVMRRGNQYMVVDLDDGRLFEYTAPSSVLHWLDEAMMYSVASEKLEVWDYDGTNRRVLVDLVNDDERTLMDCDVVIASNDKWLYYVVETDNGLVLTREKIRD